MQIKWLPEDSKLGISRGSLRNITGSDRNRKVDVENQILVKKLLVIQIFDQKIFLVRKILKKLIEKFFGKIFFLVEFFFGLKYFFVEKKMGWEKIGNKILVLKKIRGLR